MPTFNDSAQYGSLQLLPSLSLEAARKKIGSFLQLKLATGGLLEICLVDSIWRIPHHSRS